MAVETEMRTNVRVRRVENRTPFDSGNQPIDQNTINGLRARMAVGAAAGGLVAYVITTYVEPQIGAGLTSFAALIGAWAGAPNDTG